MIEKPLLYLDNCMFNRPFDEQDKIRVKLETEAKLHIQEQIRAGNFALIWSYILTYENGQNPFFDRQYSIAQWQNLATITVVENETVIDLAEQLMQLGIKMKDAFHVACAIFAKVDYFLSTDDKLLKKLAKQSYIVAINPIYFVGELHHDD